MVGRRVMLVLGLLAGSLSGCLGSTDAGEPAPPAQAAEPTPDQPLASPVSNATASDAEAGAWSSFDVAETGAAGEWLVVYQPFAEPLEGLDYRFSLDARAGGETDRPLLFIVGPTFVAEGDDGPALHGLAAFDRQGLVVGSGGVAQNAFEGNVGFGTSARLLGVLVAIAADSPWSLALHFELADEEGPSVVPGLRRGEGAVLAVGAERTLPVPDGPAGSLHLEGTAAAGWTHLQVVNVPLEPDAVHSFDFALPDGSATEGAGYRHGYWSPVGGGGASSNGMVEHFGGTGQPAGPFSMDLTYAAADLSVDLGYVNLPAGVPILGEGAGVYTDAHWPFPDRPDDG